MDEQLLQGQKLGGFNKLNCNTQEYWTMHATEEMDVSFMQL